MKTLAQQLADSHGVSPKYLKLTPNSFFSYMAFLLLKYPTKSICDVRDTYLTYAR
ncbi:unnamed protein product, partial [Nesidiocoris tenuis]